MTKGQKESYSSALSLTSALNGGGRSTLHPGRFDPGKEKAQFPLYRKLSGPPGPFWAGTNNLAPTGIRSPDRPDRTEPSSRATRKSNTHFYFSFNRKFNNCYINTGPRRIYQKARHIEKNNAYWLIAGNIWWRWVTHGRGPRSRSLPDFDKTSLES